MKILGKKCSPTWKKIRYACLIITLVVGIYLIKGTFVRKEWRSEYANRVNSEEYLMYTMETYDYDYTDSGLRPYIQKIIEDSASLENYIDRVGEFVYDNVEYDYNLIYTADCYRSKASEVLEKGRGVCSTMSVLNVAMLRGGGVMARVSRGCINTNIQPLGVFNVFGLKRFRRIKTSPIVEVDGKYPIGGSLHAWTEVYVPEKGWVILESTNANTYGIEDGMYWKYDNPIVKDQVCYLNKDFADECREFV